MNTENSVAAERSLLGLVSDKKDEKVFESVREGMVASIKSQNPNAAVSSELTRVVQTEKRLL